MTGAPKRFSVQRFFEDTDARLRRLERRTTPQVSGGGSGTGLTAEEVRDITQAQLVAGTNIGLTVDDPGDTITVSASSTTLRWASFKGGFITPKTWGTGEQATITDFVQVAGSDPTLLTWNNTTKTFDPEPGVYNFSMMWNWSPATSEKPFRITLDSSLTGGTDTYEVIQALFSSVYTLSNSAAVLTGATFQPKIQSINGSAGNLGLQDAVISLVKIA